MLLNFQSHFRQGTRSLKTVLAIYFIPISIIPAIFISLYSIRVFEESTKENLVRRAGSDRDAIIAELDAGERDLLVTSRAHAVSPQLIAALHSKSVSKVAQILSSFQQGVQIRVFRLDGRLLAERKASPAIVELAYISDDGMKRLKQRGETMERYFSDAQMGFVTVLRSLIKDKGTNIGILEEQIRFDEKNLADIKNRRQVDVVFLNRAFTHMSGSFALSDSVLKSFSSKVFRQGVQGGREPIFVELGRARFAGFLYDLPVNTTHDKQWGYVALFISMNALDATVEKLKLAIVYLTVVLILVAALLIFVFSNRIVKPIEVLVLAMKRAKTGRVEQIPNIDSTYEIEYLVRSFNEMTRNVSAAKRALELKLEELHRANMEIKNTQGHLVQSAKMISLGQIVAGVAHELNNPIAFIYSNMHHLSQYVERFNQMVKAYRKLYEYLPPEERSKLERLETELEIDYVLKDMEDLTRSCLEGANRTKDIVLGLRTFSRMEETSFRMVDIHDGIKSTLKLLSTEFKDRVTLHEEYGALPQIECSLSQLNQVFMNLLSNAAHAIHGKGDVWIRTWQEGETAYIEIEDSGAGIPKESLEKIFDPFFTTKKIGEGTGLGLSIAYGLIQKHHGHIEVASVVGKGTRFTISLPIKQPLARAG